MKKSLFALLCFLLLCSHDMYLKMDSYFLSPQQDAVIDLYNGTFDKSENIIDRDRMLDASLLGNGQRIKVAESQWSEKDSITKLHFTTGNAGTWVAGISTKARNIAMDAKAFNSYLEHDGIKDMLAQREREGTLNDDAVESYSKHVKAIFQVGDQRTNDWETPLNYPIEFVPMQNPYDVYSGGTLKVKLLRNGQPLPNQLVYADYAPSKNGHSHTQNTHTHQDSDEPHTHKKGEHTHDQSKQGDHTHTTGQELRTNSDGIVSVDLTNDGIWYMRTIHLETTKDAGLTHQSNWATLTFEVTHNHAKAQGEHTHKHKHEHEHEHEHKDGIPGYLFGIISLVVIAGLFVYYRRTKTSNS